jgi:hypothetical protein
MLKTLIGKKNYLFLINDHCKELEVHCNNICLVKDKLLPHLNFDKYMLIIFPNKSLLYKDYLPDEYIIKYRPGFDIYFKILNNKILDGYLVLKDIQDTYYKTDTHINLKGNYQIYLEFINKLNRDYNLNIKGKNIKLDVLSNVELKNLNVGIGDLTWPINLGDQILIDIKDNYYYSNDLLPFYMKYIISIDDDLKFFNYELLNITHELIGKTVTWVIISNYIIYKYNNYEQKIKVIIFYDSFLLSILPLYLELFNEVYVIKSTYNNNLIDKIKPDYVFEFRVERFLL